MGEAVHVSTAVLASPCRAMGQVKAPQRGVMLAAPMDQNVVAQTVSTAVALRNFESGGPQCVT